MPLAQSGVISVSTLEESEDRLAQQAHGLENERTRAAIEMRIKRDGVRQMEQAIDRLDAGLKVVNESIDALAVRAPIAGRLTDFRLQLGEIVKSEQHIGRIDDPSQFKLVAQIDEYYLGQVSTGKKGAVRVNGRPLRGHRQPRLSADQGGPVLDRVAVHRRSAEWHEPGQSAETRITLGGTSPAVLLPNDAFLNDSGGTRVFVLARDGRTAERRTIRLGRRNRARCRWLRDSCPASA